MTHLQLLHRGGLESVKARNQSSPGNIRGNLWPFALEGVREVVQGLH